MRELEEHFCTYTQTQKLMSLGLIGIEHLKHITPSNEILYQLSESCLGAILRSQALDFFRDKGLDFHIGGYSSKGFWFGCYKNNEGYCSPNFKLYHEAESALIDKLIELEMDVQNGK